MVSPADAERLRLAQAGIRRLVTRDLDAFFASLNLDRPERARDALLAFMPVLVSQYGESAAAVAADWYDGVRASEGVSGRYRATMAASPYLSAVDGTTRRAVGALFTDAPNETLVALRSAAPKYVLAASRQTITGSADRDPRARGWQRVTSGGACTFCRGLAARGGVYTQHSVMFAAHKACGCAAVPSWDPDAPEVDVRAYEASRRMTALRMRAARGDESARRQIEEHSARTKLWLEAEFGAD